MTAVVIVNSGGANLASLEIAFQRLGVRARVTSDAERISAASRVVLPGVGAAGMAMARLRTAGLVAVLQSLRQPVLGICLGMQLLCRRSEEDDTDCLGLLSQTARQLAYRPGTPVPHTGWNTLRPLTPDPLLEGITDTDYLYFVHRYAVAVTDQTLASCEHGQPFAAVMRTRNFWGTQFHPERSGPVGARILRNFLRL